MILFSNGKCFFEINYSLESDYENEIFSQSDSFFGKNTILIDTKTKIKSEHLGDSIPDGFLFDLSDKKNPEFYLVEVELKDHDFYRHIFPQITKFFAFFRNSEKQKELVEKLFSTINTEDTLKKQFKKYLGEKEIFKFLNDTINTSQNILIIIDGEKNEFPEIMDTYNDTWGKMVKIVELKKFSHDKDIIYTMSPEFEAIQYSTPAGEDSKTVTINEEYHLEGVEEKLKKAYFEIKEKVLKELPGASINPQKYYISIKAPKNISYITFRKGRIEIIFIIPLDEIKERIKDNSIKELSQSVQNFFNKPCGAVEIHDSNSLGEIVELFKYTYSQNNPSDDSC
jgi:predicted transport protein